MSLQVFMEEAEADREGSLEQGLAGPQSDTFWEEVRSRGPWRGLAGGQRRRLVEAGPGARGPTVKEHQVSVGRLGPDGFVTLPVPPSCRILSKLSQEINKNEERRSIFAPRK